MARKFTVVLFCIVFPVCGLYAVQPFKVNFNFDGISGAVPSNVATVTTATNATVEVRTYFSCSTSNTMMKESVVLDDNSDVNYCAIEFRCPEVDSGFVQMSFDFMVCKDSADYIHLSLRDNSNKDIAVVQYINSKRSLVMVEYESPGTSTTYPTTIGKEEIYKEDTVYHMDIILDLNSGTICFILDRKDLGSDHTLPGDAKFTAAVFNTPVCGKATIALDNISISYKPVLTCIEGLSSLCDDIRLAATEELVRRPASDPDIKKLFNMVKHDSNPQVRGAAASALVAISAKLKGTIGNSAYQHIIYLLKDKSKERRRIRRTTITALRGGKVIDEKIENLIARAPKPIVYGTQKSIHSVLTDGGFEKGLNEWTVTYHDNAAGTESITTIPKDVHGGSKALQVKKTNDLGYIRIRNNNPVNVLKGSTHTTCRLWFKSDNAPLESQLLLRAEDAFDADGVLNDGDGALTDGDPLLSAWMSQTFLRNAATGQWHKRAIMLEPNQQCDKPYFVQILLFGNPCTVTIDDVTLPAPNWDFVISDPTPSQFLLDWMNIRDELKNQPKFEGTVAKFNDKLTISIDDGIAYDDISPVLHKPLTNSRGDYTAFQDAGVSLQTIFIRIGSNNSFKKWCNNGQIEGVPTIWPTAKNQDYNFDYAIEQVKEAISKAPESYFIIDFWIVWPDDYVKENQGTAWKDEYGNEVYWLPSLYQDKPIDDANDVIREFMEALKSTPYHKRVVGCCISGGHDGQFYIWQKDYSMDGKAAWQKWLRDKYINDTALQVAWNGQNVKLDNAEVPVDPVDPNSKMFFDPNSETNLRDYREFMTERMWKIKEKLVESAELGAGKPLIGLAYTLGGGMENDFRPLFDSTYLDGCIAQPIYQYRMPGHIGGIHAAYDSFTKHGKLMIKEMDTRSWIRQAFDNEITNMYLSTPMSLGAFKKLCRKEIGQQIAHNQGWWYYDIDDNSFRNPGIMKEIATARSVADCVRQTEDSFKPDAVAVYSQDSYLWGRPTHYDYRNLPTWILEYLEMEIATSGVPMDRMYIQDLIEDDPDGDDYKMYVFMNCYALTGKQIEYIENNLKTANKTLIWHYAPGYVDIDSKKLDVNNTSSLVGMIVKTDPALESGYKVLKSGSHQLIANSCEIVGVGDMFLKQFYGSDDFVFAQRFVIDVAKTNKTTTLGKTKTLGTYSNKDVALAVRNIRDPNGTIVWTSIYASALGALSSELLNKAAFDANCYVATEPNYASLEMNGRFLSLHALKKKDNYNIRLPYPCLVFDPDPDIGQMLGIRDEINLPLTATESKWLLMFDVNCLDFEGSPMNSEYHVRDTFVDYGITMSIEPFQLADGSLTSEGFARIDDSSRAGHKGREINLDRINLKFHFNQPVCYLTLNYGDYRGNLNLKINDEQMQNFQYMSDMHDQIIDGVTLSVVDLGDDMGLLDLHGEVRSFVIGGQELWIDHICVKYCPVLPAHCF